LKDFSGVVVFSKVLELEKVELGKYAEDFSGFLLQNQDPGMGSQNP